MYVLAVIILIYLRHFAPWVFSRPLLIASLSSFILLLLIRRSCEKAFGFLLLTVLVLSLCPASALSSFSSGIPPEDVRALYGRVIQDSSQRSGRKTGFRLLVDAVEDECGSVFSARGSLYVISDQAELLYGDYVRCQGIMDGPLVIASASLIERPWHGAFRKMLLSSIKGRLMPLGDAGELAMRLLLGTGEDGSFALSDNARLSGLSHVLALSGMHLSILAYIIYIPISRLKSKFATETLTASFLISFTFLAGWRPSLVRALLFRFLMKTRCGVPEAFALSALMLYMMFPSAAADLGAEYSFISLGAIFLFSDRIDRGLRTLLPVPPSVSLSASASAAALIGAVPLTLSVFGSYQLGSVITSLPVTLMISLYMGLSMLVLVIPVLSPLLHASYRLTSLLFSLSALVPETSSPYPYIFLVLISSLLLIIARKE